MSIKILPRADRFEFSMAKEANAAQFLKPKRALTPPDLNGEAWWSFKWAPIKKKTWNVFCHFKRFGPAKLEMWWWRNDTTNGWGRSNKCFRCGITLWRFEVEAWIAWDFQALGKLP